MLIMKPDMRQVMTERSAENLWNTGKYAGVYSKL